jgi:hypothetical protein
MDEKAPLLNCRIKIRTYKDATGDESSNTVKYIKVKELIVFSLISVSLTLLKLY